MRNVTSIIILSAVLLVSCTKEFNSVEPESEVLIPERQLTLTAIGEQDASTKTVRDESDGSVWWTPGDAISVFSPTNNKFVCNATENSRIASFSGSISSQDVYSTGTKIGEIVNASGIGVVAWISDDGGTALLLSVSELQGKDWTASNDWCRSYGDGWRMPTIDELTLIHGNFSTINAGLKSSGYTQLTTANKCYWSSTVNPNNSNYYYRERVYDGTIFTNTGNDEKATSTANYTRAVKMVSRNTTAPHSLWGLYPYEEQAICDGNSVTMTIMSTQIAEAGTFSAGCFPSIGRTEGECISFFNICGGIRFSVTRGDIRKIVLRGNEGEIIAGKVQVGFSENGIPEVKKTVDGVDKIVLVPDNELFEVGHNYYIVLLPTSFTSGLTMEFETQGEIGIYKRAEQTIIKRSVFSGLRNIDSKIAEWDKRINTIGDVVLSGGQGIVAFRYEDIGASLLLSVEEAQGMTWSQSNTWCKDYGEGWRLPTKNEWHEIAKNYSYINNVLAGTDHPQLNSDPPYWASDARCIDYSTYTIGHYAVHVDNEREAAYDNSKLFNARAVKIVFDWPVETMEASAGQTYNFVGAANDYFATLSGYVDASTIDESKWQLDDYFYYSETANTIDKLISEGIRVSADNMFSARINGLKESTLYYYVACVDCKNSYGTVRYSNKGKVKVFKTPRYDLPLYVDFHLPSGTKWGTVNLGASDPTKVGSEYQWGTFVGHGENYNAGDVLPSSNDYARMKLGDGWRIPRKEDWEELFKCCSCSYYTTSPGMKVSRDGVSILIPLSNYWSSTCATAYWRSGVETGYGYMSATAFALLGNSAYFKDYVNNRVLNTTFGVDGFCQIRAVYVGP